MNRAIKFLEDLKTIVLFNLLRPLYKVFLSDSCCNVFLVILSSSSKTLVIFGAREHLCFEFQTSTVFLFSPAHLSAPPLPFLRTSALPHWETRAAAPRQHPPVGARKPRRHSAHPPARPPLIFKARPASIAPNPNSSFPYPPLLPPRSSAGKASHHKRRLKCDTNISPRRLMTHLLHQMVHYRTTLRGNGQRSATIARITIHTHTMILIIKRGSSESCAMRYLLRVTLIHR